MQEMSNNYITKIIMHGFTWPPAAPSQAFWPINLSQGPPSLMGAARRAAHLVAPTPHNRDMTMSQCFKKNCRNTMHVIHKKLSGNAKFKCKFILDVNKQNRQTFNLFQHCSIMC